jgi:hypothetical protein
VHRKREPSTTGRLLRLMLDDAADDDDDLVLAVELGDNADLMTAFSKMLSMEVAETVLEVDIVDGAVRSSTYQFLNDTGGQIATMQIRWIDMSRATSYELRLFELPWGLMRARQQYHPPESLPVDVHVSPEPLEFGGFREHYTINWRGVPMTLLMTPSMGGLGEHSRGELWAEDLTAHLFDVDSLSVIWADGHDAGYPSHAIWDTGQFRF